MLGADRCVGFGSGGKVDPLFRFLRAVVVSVGFVATALFLAWAVELRVRYLRLVRVRSVVGVGGDTF